MKKKSTARKTKSSKKSRSTLKKKFLFWQRGEIAIYLLLGIIIAGAFLIASGGPVFNLSQPDQSPVGEPIIVTPTGHDTLQLQTLKFQACGNTTSVDFLVDTSGSMRDNNKIGNIKEALTSFASKLTDKSVVGIRRFSSSGNRCYPSITSRLVPIGLYSANKNTFSQQVNALCADGGTNTGTAFAAELNDLTQAVANPAYKDTPLNLVFISDGIPEGQAFSAGGDCQQHVSPAFPVCAPYNQGGNNVCRCFDSSQDPTFNPQIAQKIQALKNINGKPVRVFSVLVFDPVTDAPFLSKLNNMMTTIASTPSNFYKTANPEDITNIYSQIAEKICASNGGGSTTPTP